MKKIATITFFAVFSACASNTTTTPANGGTKQPASCEELNAQYREALTQTSCSSVADCTHEVSGDLFCFAGPFKVNPRDSAKIDELVKTFSASCTELPCTPAARAWTTTCEAGHCKTAF